MLSITCISAAQSNVVTIIGDDAVRESVPSNTPLTDYGQNARVDARASFSPYESAAPTRRFNSAAVSFEFRKRVSVWMPRRRPHYVTNLCTRF